MATLYKTTIVIYTDYPVAGRKLDDLGHEAEVGDAICDEKVTVEVDENDVSDEVRDFFALKDFDEDEENNA